MQYRKTSLVSQKLLEQRRRRRTFIFSIVLSVLMVLSVLVFFVFRAKSLFITEIKVSGNKIVDASKIEEVVFPILNENSLKVFPKKNRLIYPKELIESKIKKEIGRVESLTLNVEKHTLLIDITERGSYALWCQKEEDDCYFIDSAGFIFSKSPDFSEGIYLIYEGIVTDTEPLGKQFLDESMLQTTDEISRLLSSANLYVEKIKVNTLRDTEFITESGLSLKLDLTKSATTTKQILTTLFASKEFKENTKGLTALDYIDARFGSKVFFKSTKSAQSAAAVTSFE